MDFIFKRFLYGCTKYSKAPEGCKIKKFLYACRWCNLKVRNMSAIYILFLNSIVKVKLLFVTVFSWINADEKKKSVPSRNWRSVSEVMVCFHWPLIVFFSLILLCHVVQVEEMWHKLLSKLLHKILLHHYNKDFFLKLFFNMKKSMHTGNMSFTASSKLYLHNLQHLSKRKINDPMKMRIELNHKN